MTKIGDLTQIKDDALLVVRGTDGKTYKVTGQQFKKLFGNNPDGAAGPITDSTPFTVKVATDENLDVFNVGDELVMVDGSNVVSDYTMVTTDIVSVTELIPPPADYYEIRVDLELGGTPQAYDSLPVDVANVVMGQKPSSSTMWNTLYTKLNTPSIPYFVRYAGRVNGYDTTLFSSDDGVNWDEEVSLDYLPASDDESLKGSRPRQYFAWKFNTGNDVGTGKVKNYGIQKVSTEVYGQELAFEPGVPNPDLKFFRPGDVVQRPEYSSPVIHTTSNPDGTWENSTKFTAFDVAQLDMTSTAVQAVPNNTVSVPSGKAYKQLVFDLLSKTGTDFKFGSTVPGWKTAKSNDGINWIPGLTTSPGTSGVSIRSLIGDGYRYFAIGSNTAAADWSTITTVEFNTEIVDLWTSGEYEPSKLSFENEVKVLSTDLVANTMVVDSGNWGWNEVNDWVQYVTPESGIYETNRGPDKAFDGKLYADSGGWGNACMPVSGTATFSFPGRIAFNGKFRINFTKNQASKTWAECSSVITINGIDIIPWLQTNYPDWGAVEKLPSDWIDLSGELTSGLNLGTSLDEIVFSGSSATANTRLYAIEVDDRILLQGSESVIGGHNVSYGPVTGTGKFVSTDSVDTINVEDSNDRWIDTSNRLGREFYVHTKF